MFIFTIVIIQGDMNYIQFGCQILVPTFLTYSYEWKEWYAQIYTYICLLFMFFFTVFSGGFCYTSMLKTMNHRFDACNQCYHIGPRGDGNHSIILSMNQSNQYQSIYLSIYLYTSHMC